MTFILVFIFVAIGIIFLVLEKFSWLIFLTLSLLIMYMISRAIKERKTIKKVYETSFLELCLVLIKQIEGYKQLIIKNNKIILISEYGIFIICAIDRHGIISGNITEKTLNIKYNNAVTPIYNDFYGLEQLVEQYEKIALKQINVIAITANDCDITFNHSFLVSKYRLFINDFKKNYKNKIYNINEINYIYNTLKDNVNLCQKT